MIFYAVDLFTVPKINFACSVDVENYKNVFNKNKNFLEIAVCEEGRIVYLFPDGREEIADTGCCLPIFQDVVCRTYAFRNERQRHTTVGVLAEYRQERMDSETADVSLLRKRVRENRTILLPYHYPLGETAQPMTEKIRRVIRLHHSGNPSDSLRALAAWYEMTAYVTDFTLQELSGRELAPAMRHYLEKACRYMDAHFAEDLTVAAVAERLGISPGYLHHIFQLGLGCGIREYLNHCRVEAFKQYVKSRELSLKEAAAQVGVEDPAYMSRLFKKETGINFRQYKQNCGENQTE